MQELRKVTGAIIGIFIGLIAHSQAELSFCTFVNNDNHECVFNNVKFITPLDSTRARLYMLLNSVDTFATKQIAYKIYAIDRFDEEVYLNTVTQQVQTEWKSAWYPYVFTSPGKYIVKVYRDSTHVLVSRGFEFFNH